MDQSISRRASELLLQHERAIAVRTDRLFVRLMLSQWVAGIVLAVTVSPMAWAGTSSTPHAHVLTAVLLGGLITLVPVVTARRHPGTLLSRHSIAVGQALTSALLIHLSGGRIETHFHVFGSLAFLAFYRDWKVIVTASAVVALDHMARGIFWPQSVFGVFATSQWRWLEHAAWVLFEDIFLIHSCLHSWSEAQEIALRRATLEGTNEAIEAEVRTRTLELLASNTELQSQMSERAEAEMERDELTHQLMQAQKLEAVGQLAAGIAHEINTPTQFVGDNTRFLKESFHDLNPLLEKASRLAEAVCAGTATPLLGKEFQEGFDGADTAYLVTEVPRAIEQSLDGIERIRRIVLAMKEFSHPGVEGMTSIDINRAIASTITVATNEWKYVAEIQTDFDSTLPPVPCLPGEINQVILNVIVNAAHAIADALGDNKQSRGTIAICTRRDGDFAEIRISDTGTGIPVAVREKVFDPFFTTKEVGKGTGQGLSIAYAVVVKKHGGTLDFESAAGRGTTFVIRLPLAVKKAKDYAA